MKQVLQDRRGLTVVRDVPIPPCPPNGVLVRNHFSVISSGTERTRVELSQKSLIGKARERPDLVRQVIDRARKEGLQATRQAVQSKLVEETAVGYSSAGIVEEVGPEVVGLLPGDRVACCGGGHANHAEVVAMPRNLCVPVPPGVPLEVAGLATIAAIALHGLRLSAVEVGSRVGIVGCGLVGQIACRLATAAGAEVYAIDIDQARVDQALAGGADHGFLSGDAKARVDDVTRGIGLDGVVVTAGAPVADPLVLATEIARDRGTVVLVGAVPIALPRPPMYDKEVTFRVSRSYGPGRYDRQYEERGLDYPIAYVRWTEQRNLAAVLDLQARGRIDLRDLIEEVVPVEDAPAAYARLVEDPPRGALALAYPTSKTESTPPSPPEHPTRADAGPAAVGLIGPGGFASRVLVPAFKAAGASLEAVAGGKGPSAEAARRNLGFARTLDSEEALIADPAVTAVVIATRHGSHAALAAGALRAGKHVFCEKPLALSEAELNDVLDAERTSQCVLTVGFNRRFSPMVAAAREFLLVATGRRTVHYRVSAGAIPDDHWVHDIEQGGGRILGEVCHFVDTLAFVVGSQVSAVHAAGHGNEALAVQANDDVTVNLRFEDGSVGSLLYTARGSGRLGKERLEAFAGDRTVVMDDFHRLELFDGTSVQTTTSRSQDKGHRAEAAAFVASLQSGIPPISLVELENVSRATIGVVESLRTAKPVVL